MGLRPVEDLADRPVLRPVAVSQGASMNLDWTHLLKKWAGYQLAIGVPRTTRVVQQNYVTRLSKAFPLGPDTISFEDLIDWFASYDWKPNTRRSARTALRAFWQWLMATGRASSSPAHLLPRMPQPRAKPRPTPEHVYHEALGRSAPREQLMIRLAAVCGLRCGEISRVHSDDLATDLEGWALHVHGKGGHDRWVPLTAELARDLLALPKGWAFPSRQGPEGHLTAWWIGKLVSTVLTESAEATGTRWTTHTLRHRCATIAYAAERDLLAVQDLLGHAKPETTRIYIATPTGAVRRAVEHAAGQDAVSRVTEEGKRLAA